MSIAAVLGQSAADHPLRDAFLKWQCRVRQLAMRDGDGRPDDAITPELRVTADAEPMGHVITIMNKAPSYNVISEMEHMAAKTNDPAQIRSSAIQFFSSTYYQKAREFSDILTATFPPGSPGAAKIREAETCFLKFDAYRQIFDLPCKVWVLAPHNPLHRATLAHNKLFNPAMPPDQVVLGFEPDWGNATSDPKLV
ncbi:MAG: hypothetical protein AAF557_27090 [Pseudomonadota bacterium]